MRHAIFRAVPAFILLAGTAREAVAQTDNWINPTIGNWFIGSNWDQGVPQPGSIAKIANGGAAIIDSAGAVANFVEAGSCCGLSGSVFVIGNGRLTLGARLFVYTGTIEVNSGARVTVLDDPNIGGRTEIGSTNGTGTLRITDANSYLLSQSFYLPAFGGGRTGVLRIENGGRVDTTAAYMFADSSHPGTAFVTGSNSIWAVSSILGMSSPGATASVSSGGTMSVYTANIYSGASITVSGVGSALNTTSAVESMFLGTLGTGTLSIQSGGKATSTNAHLGDGSSTSASGTVTIAGSGSSWSNAGLLYLGGSAIVGSAGTGTVNVLNGGLLTTSASNAGYTSSSIGNATVTGTGSRWNNSGDLVFGLTGTGSLQILSGGAVSSAGFTNVRGYLGFNDGSSGGATVSGTGSSWTTTGSLWIGNGGSGSLLVSNGATVTTGGNGYLGFDITAYGSAIISGAGSAWNTAGTVIIGGNGGGPGGNYGSYLQIEDDASVNGGAILLYNTGKLNLVNNTTCTGPLTSVGGLIHTYGNTAFANNITLNSGGISIINQSSGTNSTFSGTLTGSGGLTKAGASTVGLGSLTLTGASSYSGATTVNRGALLVNGSITSPTTVNSGGVLGGSGTVGDVTINSGAVLAPGNSPGKLNTGNVALSSGAAYIVELNGATITATPAIAATVVISEFRTRGPSGGNDEFIELYNNSASAVDISGWKIKGSNSAGIISTRVTINAGTMIPARGHFLATNNGSSGYSGGVVGNQTYNSGITDDGGIAVTDPSDAIADQVGMSTGSAFKEGNVLAPFTPGNTTDRSYERKPGGAGGSTQDTNDNTSDFQIIIPSDPQNLSSSPTPGSEYDQINATGTVSLGDASLSVSLGFLPTPGTMFFIVNNNDSDAVAGIFDGLPQDALFSQGGAQFQISYTGDSETGSLSGGNDVVLLVTRATVALTTVASATTTVGGEISDTATVSGGMNPTGTISFSLYGPDDASCSETPVFTSTVPVNGNGDYNSGSFTAATPGIYYFVASYSGDVNNDATDSPCQAPNESVVVTPAPLQLVDVASIKTHGSAGSFGINLPLTGTAGIECRTGGVNSDFQVILTFSSPILDLTGSSVTTGTGEVSDVELNGSQVIVRLTGVTNAQAIVLTLFGVTNGTNTSDISVPMGVLVGDTTGNGFVNAGDSLQTRNRSGQAADAMNFRSDVNADGFINSGDTIVVRSRSGTSLP